MLHSLHNIIVYGCNFFRLWYTSLTQNVHWVCQIAPRWYQTMPRLVVSCFASLALCCASLGCVQAGSARQARVCGVDPGVSGWVSVAVRGVVVWCVVVWCVAMRVRGVEGFCVEGFGALRAMRARVCRAA